MTTSGINTSGITTDANGRVRISGASSNIDWKSIVDTQILAKRQPAVQLETKISANLEKINAYKTLKTQASTISVALNKLRSAPGSSVDVFNTKLATGTTAAAVGAPSGFTPSSIGSLLLTSIGSTAQNGTYSVRIIKTAQAQQIRTDSISSTTTSLASLGITPGTFTLGGKTITLGANDTLQDLRANINAAGAGVTASVISASASDNYLVLTASSTGVANTMNFAGGNSLSDALGLTAAGTVKTQLVSARDAELNVNGINGITRSSNNISDVINGVTLNLLKAEANTDITLKIEPDLNTIKTAIGEFVDAYNEMRAYFTEQRTASDRNDDGTIEDNELGVLAYDQRLRDIMTQLGNMAATTVASNADGFRSLSQIGITLNANYELQIDDAVLDAKLLSNVGEIKKLFGFNATTSDSRATILGRTSATQAGTYYLNIAGTNTSGNVLSANLNTVPGVGLGGADNGSATVTSQTISGATGGSQGLGVFFNGGNSLGPINGITLTVTRGVADQFYDFFNDLVTTNVGGLDTTSNTLLTQNSDYQSRIETLDTRLEFIRASLENRFVRMEAALAQLENLRNTIQQYTDSNNGAA